MRVTMLCIAIVMMVVGCANGGESTLSQAEANTWCSGEYSCTWNGRLDGWSQVTCTWSRSCCDSARGGDASTNPIYECHIYPNGVPPPPLGIEWPLFQRPEEKALEDAGAKCEWTSPTSRCCKPDVGPIECTDYYPYIDDGRKPGDPASLETQDPPLEEVPSAQGAPEANGFTAEMPPNTELLKCNSSGTCCIEFEGDNGCCISSEYGSWCWPNGGDWLVGD